MAQLAQCRLAKTRYDTSRFVGSDGDCCTFWQHCFAGSRACETEVHVLQKHTLVRPLVSAHKKSFKTWTNTGKMQNAKLLTVTPAACPLGGIKRDGIRRLEPWT